MDIWIALLIEALDTEPLTHGEPIAIEAFLSEEECWQFVRSDKMTDKAREIGAIETNKYYMLACRPLGKAAV